jgi:FtsZ-binding cell division protein ZapB
MSNSIQEENEYLKREVERLKQENEALEVIKKKWQRHVDYEIKSMSEHMPEGKAKEDLIKMMMKQFF